ncbi:flagellar biosynthetic protein FliP [Tepiditoga spiralis]|uniref:Flagellar biosynthetic protein FliP n=1 Tax=Tepiditoga spiralis TaxID=2108365 RepID=A0A7G1GBR6_9BACT|nr:flagellar type III secretion system pore protein FliP [Tepiditoga spiralis]BBE31299.1 flagellar biosynthetic protein FliP [Tepiditoga spiralis]
MNKKKLLATLFFIFLSIVSYTEDVIPGISININQNNTGTLTPTLLIILIISVLSIAPGLLMMLTSFTRIVIVMGFLRQAIGTRQAPPNQVLVSIALLLTIMIMYPTFNNVYEKAIVPYNNGTIGYEKAFENTWTEFKTFMLREITYHKNQDDIYMLASSLKVKIKDIKDTPFQILVPAFALSELEIAFKMGILIYLPFIIVDMVVASVLLSMGMMMIPPILISLPFKLLLFVIINGWDLLMGSLINSFAGG